MATRTDAPPPKPFSSATICGIAVILTARAEITPITPPTSTPTRIAENPTISRSSSVARTAMSIPVAPSAFPLRAVAGEERRLSPRMKRTDATR